MSTDTPGALARTVTVARNDFLNVRRAKLIWFVCGLYALFAALVFYFADGSSVTMNAGLWSLTGIGVILMPLVALVASYLAIAGERESGTIKLRLGLPTTRLQLLVAKFLSRALLVSLAVVLSVLVACAVALWQFQSPEFGAVPGFTAITVLFTLTYVSTATGLSAMVGSRAKAMGAVIGYYFVFTLLWAMPTFSIPGAIRLVLNDTLGLGLHEDFFAAMQLSSPVWAYLNASLLVISAPGGANPGAAPSDPFYLQSEFAPVVLAFWVVAPLAAGYLVLRRADIG